MVRSWLEAYPEFLTGDGSVGTPSQSGSLVGGGLFNQSHEGGSGELTSPSSSSSEAKDLRRLRVLTTMKTPIGMDMEKMNFSKVRHSVIANLSLLLYRLANPNDPNSEGYNYRENMFAADVGSVGRSTSKPRRKPNK